MSVLTSRGRFTEGISNCKGGRGNSESRCRQTESAPAEAASSIFSGLYFDPEGKPLTKEQWEARKDEFLPSAADRAYVKSLQAKAIVEPGKMANWIAPPPRGVNAKPVEFEYVRAEA